jgi:hypothetical protein
MIIKGLGEYLGLGDEGLKDMGFNDEDDVGMKNVT